MIAESRGKGNSHFRRIVRGRWLSPEDRKSAGFRQLAENTGQWLSPRIPKSRTGRHRAARRLQRKERNVKILGSMSRNDLLFRFTII
jgi:hypothetical protein